MKVIRRRDLGEWEAFAFPDSPAAMGTPLILWYRTEGRRSNTSFTGKYIQWGSIGLSLV